MPDFGYINQLIRKYSRRSVIIDTNLVLLLIIGAMEKNPKDFKRTVQFINNDVVLLRRVVSAFSRLITTPNIVTEVDNLSRNLPEREHQNLSKAVNLVFDQAVEIYVPSKVVLSTSDHPRFGVSDCVSLSLIDQGVLTITDDFKLYGKIVQLGYDAININHVRTFID